MVDADLFDHYEKELRDLVASATKKNVKALNEITTASNVSKTSLTTSSPAVMKSRVISEGADDDVADAKEVYRLMQLEVKRAEGDRRGRLDAKLTAAKMELDRITEVNRHSKTWKDSSDI